ncbi:MAG: PIG-L family deacetylase [Planctomycetes bacterium]|nr:PIG-L family deacetylase [Planctomycetota bacterium]
MLLRSLAVLVAVPLAAGSGPAPTDPARPQGGEVAFRQALLDATTDAVVLNLAAHPDDEAARTMVMLRNKFGVRTVTAYATCGEGGQNAIGPEIGRRLAAIRVRETLRAAERYGSEVRWLGFADFGYSKSLDETLAAWGREETLARIAAVVDAVRPDIVLTNHAVDRGHGHHRAVAWAAEQVCAARGLPLYQRAFGDGDPGGTFAFDPRELDPLRGITFARQAHDAWVMHESQGPWRAHDPTRVGPDRWRQVAPAGGPVDPLARLGSFLADERVRELLGSELDGVARELATLGAEAPRSAHVGTARRLLAALRELRARLGDGEMGRRVERRIDALERVVALGVGVQLETFLPDDELPLGGSLPLRVTLQGAAVEAPTFSADAGAAVAPGEDGWAELALRLPDDARPDPLLDLTRVFGVRVEARFAVDGLPLRLATRVDVRVTPSSEVAWERADAYVPSGQPWRRVLSLLVERHGAARFAGDVSLRAPAGLRVEAIPARVVLDDGQRSAQVLVRVERLAAATDGDGASLDTGPIHVLARVGDAGAARATLQPLPVVGAGQQRIGLVRGPDDTTQRFLEDLGAPFEVLDPTGLAVAELDRFSTIVLDIRACYHRPDLQGHRERLLRYCRAGGRILALYHKEAEWNEAPGRPALAPFELQIGGARVSEEDAPVAILAPAHPLLSAPFAIGIDDFDGWVQERGLNFPSARDPAWVPLLEMHDAGEPPLDGALLAARYGRGEFVYCSLALYRQLRIAHAGAARLFVDLLWRQQPGGASW